MLLAMTTPISAVATASPSPPSVIDIVHPQSAQIDGYRLSVINDGAVRVTDGNGKFLREVHIPANMTNLLFTSVAQAPPLNTLAPGTCDNTAPRTDQTFLRFGGFTSPNLQCFGGNGFLGIIWGIVQQIIGSAGMGGKSPASGGLGGLGNLGSLFGLGGLLGGKSDGTP